jgi:hypothetical protein
MDNGVEAEFTVGEKGQDFTVEFPDTADPGLLINLGFAL